MLTPAAGVFLFVFLWYKPSAVDKNRFRNISFCAIGALLALAFVQAWSLWRMYADRAEEFSRKVTLAMNRAAYDDLLMGNRRRTSQTRTSVVTTGNIDSVKLDMIDTISVKSLGAAGKVLSIWSKVDTLRRISPCAAATRPVISTRRCACLRSRRSSSTCPATTPC